MLKKLLFMFCASSVLQTALPPKVWPMYFAGQEEGAQQQNFRYSLCYDNGSSGMDGFWDAETKLPPRIDGNDSRACKGIDFFVGQFPTLQAVVDQLPTTVSLDADFYNWPIENQRQFQEACFKLFPAYCFPYQKKPAKPDPDQVSKKMMANVVWSFEEEDYKRWHGDYIDCLDTMMQRLAESPNDADYAKDIAFLKALKEKNWRYGANIKSIVNDYERFLKHKGTPQDLYNFQKSVHALSDKSEPTNFYAIQSIISNIQKSGQEVPQSLQDALAREDAASKRIVSLKLMLPPNIREHIESFTANPNTGITFNYLSLQGLVMKTLVEKGLAKESLWESKPIDTQDHLTHTGKQLWDAIE